MSSTTSMHRIPNPPNESDDLESADVTTTLLPSPVSADAQSIKSDKAAAKKRVSLIACITLMLVALFTTLLFAWRHRRSHDEPTRHKVIVQAAHGAVAAEVETCSDIGVQILKDGGNAVDAAIAAGICVGSINMFSSGIGGGGFMMIRHQNGSAHNINFREAAPALAHKWMYEGNPKASQIGALAVGVPGEVAGYGAAHALYGKLPWNILIEPSVKLAREGILVQKDLASRLKLLEEDFLADPAWRTVVAPNGTLLAEGDMMYRLNYSNTLERIASHGPSAFYKKPIASHIVDFLAARGGILTLDDMASYEAKVEEPIKGWYHGREVLTCRAPCSGPVLLEALNIVEGLDLKNVGYTPLGAHYLVEAMKWASAGRTELGDYVEGDPDNSVRIAELLTKEWAAKARANISSDETYGWEHYGPKYDFVENHGTTHLSVVDKDGMAASITSTVNLYFGSRLIEPTTGIILNDEMDDFSQPGVSNAFNLTPSIYNFIRPFKRPLSSSAPAIIVHDGDFELALGSSGGSRIVTAVFEAIVRTYDWGFNLLDVVEAPRLHHQLLPASVSVESGVSEDIINGLRERGHEVDIFPASRPRAEVQVVRRYKGRQKGKTTGWVEGVSDSRKGGVAAGY
ncbi:hypothetical protein YB2330_000662 [Saitoella coloradoensis]